MATPDEMHAMLDRAVARLDSLPDLVPGAIAQGRRQRRRGRLAVAGGAAVVLTTLAAVSYGMTGGDFGTAPNPSPADAPPPTSGLWLEPAGYSFVLDSRCGERTLLGRFRVTVADHGVVDVRALDEPAEIVVRDPELRAVVPTLAMLVEEYREGTATADVSEMTADPTDGHPVEIAIDYDVEAMDDEACYVISDYRVGT